MSCIQNYDLHSGDLFRKLFGSPVCSVVNEIRIFDTAWCNSVSFRQRILYSILPLFKFQDSSFCRFLSFKIQMGSPHLNRERKVKSVQEYIV